MYSSPADANNLDMVKHTRKQSDMSYTFGPHTRREGAYVLYGGDARVVKQDPNTIPVTTRDTPRWLIADWIIAEADGQPISPQARAFLNSSSQSIGLQWLRQFCQER